MGNKTLIPTKDHSITFKNDTTIDLKELEENVTGITPINWTIKELPIKDIKASAMKLNHE